MSRVRGLLPLVLLAGLAAGAVRGEDDVAQRIVDRAIAFHGGDLYERSRTSLTLRSLSGTFEITSEVRGGLFRHVVTWEGPDGVLQRVRVDNETVERWQEGRWVPVPEERQQRLRSFVEARVYFPFLPYRLNDPGVRKRSLGTETWDGRELDKIHVTFEPGPDGGAEDEYVYWFDPETGRLEQYAYAFEGDPGGLRFRKGLEYRRVGGLLFFDVDNLGIDGTELEVTDLDPQSVGRLERISRVQLSDVVVEPL